MLREEIMWLGSEITVHIYVVMVAILYSSALIAV